MPYTLKMLKILGKTEVERRTNDKQTMEIKQYQYEEMITEWYKFICEKKKKIWETEM